MKKQNIFLFIFLLIVGASCSKSFFDINTDPNNPSTATPKLVLPAGMASTAYVAGGWYQLLGGFWAQHWAQSTGATQWTNIEDYNLQSDDFDTRQFGALYSGSLNDLEYIRKEAGKSKDWTYYLIATCVQSYTFQILADLYDKIPFTEALQGTSNFSPKWDDGSLVYDSLIKRLDFALAQDFTLKSAANPLATTTAVEKEDIYFSIPDNLDPASVEAQNLKVAQWKKFANTLKLKIYLHEVYAKSAVADAGIKALLAENNFLTEDAKMTAFSADEQDKRNPIYETGVDRLSGNIVASATLLNFLNNNNDPRLSGIFKKSETGAVWRGIQQGHYKTDAATYPNIKNFSTPKLAGLDPVYIISAAESYFLQAEAQLRFGTDAQAQAMYVKGIQASMIRFGVTDNPALYGAGGVYEYPATNFEDKLKAIITQKWVALANSQSLEAFFDFNRTGYPNIFTVSSSNATSNQFPKRLLFPDSEKKSNPNTPGIVPITTKIWWDKK